MLFKLRLAIQKDVADLIWPLGLKFDTRDSILKVDI